MAVSLPTRLAGLATALALTAGAWAQEPGSPESTMTLHVYANLEQIPTLVLTWDHQRVKKFDPERLRVVLDHGQPFKPAHVRIEGDDPISLTILSDTTQPKSELTGSLVEAVAALGPAGIADGRPGRLLEHDRVTLYAMDCALIRSAADMPANAGSMRFAMEQALQPMVDRTAAKAAPCKARLPLWDSMAVAAMQLRKLPGRRVLVVIAPDGDAGSQTKPEKLMEILQEAGIAVFSLQPVVDRSGPSAPTAFGRITSRNVFVQPESGPVVNFLNSMAESTGGVTLPAAKSSLASQLARVVEMLRERYVVETSRKNEDKAGLHRMEVFVPKSDFYVRPTGISVPIADPRIVANAPTVPGAGAAVKDETSTAPQ